MFRKYVLPVLAVLGVVFGIFMVQAGNKPPPVAQPVAQPATSKFERVVAGSGLVEAATENIAIGTPVAGLVTDVSVQVGSPIRAGLPHELVRRLAPHLTVGTSEEAHDDMMLSPMETRGEYSATRPADLAQPAAQKKVNINTATTDELAALPEVTPALVQRIIAARPYASVWDLEGTALFRIDDRHARADLAVKRANAEQARRKLAKALQGTRSEEITVAEAQVAEAQAAYETARRNFTRWASVEDRAAVPPDELANRESAMKEAQARLRIATATLEKLRAGTWQPDIEIARAELQAADAEVRAAQTEIARLTVRSPIDGTVLQVKIRPGEFANTGVLQTPLMLVGRIDRLHIRVDVDEHEALRVRTDARATASIRGDGTRKADLTFIRIEPYVIPKKSLTGDSSERVDTRVMQVIYAFDPRVLPALVGQQMDVFIEVPQNGSGTKPATSTATP